MLRVRRSSGVLARKNSRTLAWQLLVYMFTCEQQQLIYYMALTSVLKNSLAASALGPLRNLHADMIAFTL